MKLAIVLLLALPLVTFGQVAAGKIQGTITDPSGAVIQGAQVTIRDTATDALRTAVASGDGFYAAPDLPAGVYEITAVAEGFKKAVVKGITLAVGAEPVVNLTLAVGSASERIEVDAAPPTVALATSALAAEVGSKTILELPLNARDWSTLATLESGVSVVRTQPPLSLNNTRGNRGLGTQLTVAGGRPQQNNYRMDGISVNDYTNAGPGSVLGVQLGVDAVQEFSVVAGNAPAEYGRSAGGIVNSITRSGGNAVHGSAYEFFRNSALDARNFFDPATIPSFRRNQFGGSVGGPIVRDKTFFFVDFESVRQGLGITTIDTVPSLAARQGKLVAGNVTVDPKVAPYLAVFPTPNGPVSGDFGIYSFGATQVTNENYLVAHVTQNLSASDTLAGSLMYDHGRESGPDALNTELLGATSDRELLTLAETHVFSPRLLNSLRVGVSRVVSEAPQTLNALNPIASDPTLAFVSGAYVGNITVTGATPFTGGLGAIGEYDYRFTSYQFYNDAFYTRGVHSLKFGLAVEHIADNQAGIGSPSGFFTFGSLRNFLLNQPASFKAPLTRSGGVLGTHETIVAGYVGDDWRVRPNLTLNLGLRYEMATVPAEEFGRLSNLPALTSTQPHLGSPFFQNPTTRNFEPRIGLAWDPFGDGKTAVRSAFGIFDVLPLPYLFTLIELQSAPYTVQGNASPLPAGTFPSGAYSQLTSGTLRYAYVEPRPRRNYVMQWNFNIQRQLGSDWTLTAGYIGSRGVHQPYRGEDANIVMPTATPQGYRWPTPRGSGTKLNPNAGQISTVMWEADSYYDGLQLKLLRKFSRRLQGQASYTWGKSIDTSSASIAGDNYSNSVTGLPFFDTRITHGLSDFDVRQNFVGSLIWQVPDPKWNPAPLRWLADGWQTSLILSAQTGLPFSVEVGGDALGLNSATTFDFPTRLNTPGCQSAVNPGSVNYVKAQCFQFTGTLMGNAGRNSVPGPGLVNADVSLLKNHYIRGISETFNVQFRAEFFNILNHTNFADPYPKANRQIFDQNGAVLASGGLITSTATTSRQVQFALKIIW
jgi:hypothetical protein